MKFGTDDEDWLFETNEPAKKKVKEKNHDHGTPAAAVAVSSSSATELLQQPAAAEGTKVEGGNAEEATSTKTSGRKNYDLTSNFHKGILPPVKCEDCALGKCSHEALLHKWGRRNIECKVVQDLVKSHFGTDHTSWKKLTCKDCLTRRGRGHNNDDSCLKERCRRAWLKELVVAEEIEHHGVTCGWEAFKGLSADDTAVLVSEYEAERRAANPPSSFRLESAKKRVLASSRLTAAGKRKIKKLQRNLASWQLLLTKSSTCFQDYS